MVSLRRLVSVWSYLHISIGSGLMAITQALLERAVKVPLLVGAVGALLTAGILLRRSPELDTSVVRRFGLLTLVLFITGHVLVADGFKVPPGESSPLTIGLLWIASMAVAYELSAGGLGAPIVIDEKQ
ncbi:hypothetical protein [Halopiger djelfimassiliensis]|uniref:hypothetical protein n=1 Tax=Halopiger djelfimassiliensis TaxID=1293047 RepID=UPI000677CD7B|nr:hypothetical protein [Halopiger djelfimassiliensis]